MKKIIKLIGFLLILIYAQPAMAINLAWDPPTTGGPVEGYIVSWTDGTTTRTKQIPPSATSATIDDQYLEMGQAYTFVVYAYNSGGRGVDSNAITYTRTVYTPPTDSTLTVQGTARPATITGARII